MPTNLDQYRAAKADYLKLRNEAKKELIARFNELANELLNIQQELRDDFGQKVTMPVKPKKTKTAAAPAAAASVPSNNGKVAAVQKKIDMQKKKLADLQAAGKPTKTVEDRIYELEDELRLAKEG
jgi:hypothetical protein